VSGVGGPSSSRPGAEAAAGTACRAPRAEDLARPASRMQEADRNARHELHGSPSAAEPQPQEGRRASILEIKPRIARIARIDRAIPIRAISVIRGSTSRFARRARNLNDSSTEPTENGTYGRLSEDWKQGPCSCDSARLNSLDALGVLCGWRVSQVTTICGPVRHPPLAYLLMRPGHRRRNNRPE